MTRSRSARARCSPGPATSTPAIEGHGTLTASNVLGQGVVNGLAPCFADLAGRPGAQPCSGGGTYPGAVIGGAPKAKGAPFGDIYFSFEFSTQFGYLLATRHGIDVTSNSYGSSAADNDGYDAASQEADLIYNKHAHDPGLLDGQRRARLRHGHCAAAPCRHRGRRLHAVRRHRLGLDQEREPDH